MLLISASVEQPVVFRFEGEGIGNPATPLCCAKRMQPRHSAEVIRDIILWSRRKVWLLHRTRIHPLIPPAVADSVSEIPRLLDS